MIAYLYNNSVYTHVIQRNLKGSKANPNVIQSSWSKTLSKIKLENNKWQKRFKENAQYEIV